MNLASDTAQVHAVYLLLLCVGCLIWYGLLAFCAIPDLLDRRKHLQRQREGEFLVRQYLAVRDDVQ